MVNGVQDSHWLRERAVVLRLTRRLHKAWIALRILDIGRAWSQRGNT
ncbi:unnamed protein product [Periconia digitata]|uniref:Uncharacterized protein n=1 Tax=Periconia digitata TaxID=1303443 RepID=A0A9W4UC42_9PLEO|nr:unnamed protein product [Periconia digitata]